MTWNNDWPDGTKSVKTNENSGVQNTQYIKSRMNFDHYWDQDADSNGHHAKVEMPSLENASTFSKVTLDANNDPSAFTNTSMKCMFYTRPKTSTEAPGNQISEPYAFVEDTANTAKQYMQIGARVMLKFSVSGGSIVNNANGNPWDYMHNITNVVRDSTGIFNVTFKTLPSADYVAIATALRDSGSVKSVNIKSQTTTTLQLLCTNEDGNARDPSGINLIIFGG